MVGDARRHPSLLGAIPIRGSFFACVASLKRCNESKTRPELDPTALIALADTYSLLGEKDEAFEFLEAAYQERASLLIYLGVRPTFDNIRSDPRYADLLRRMGLPQVLFPKPS